MKVGDDMVATYYVSGSMPNYSDEREYWRWAKGGLHYWHDFELDIDVLNPNDLVDCLDKIKSVIDAANCKHTVRSIIEKATVNDVAYSTRFKRLIIYGDNCTGVYVDLDS